MPDIKQAHISRALTEISVAYIQDESNFIADKVFPRIPVQQQTNTYYRYNKGDFFRDEMRERGKASESHGADYRVEAADPYFCRKKAFHTYVTEDDRNNFDAPLDADIDATHFVTQKGLLSREVLWANNYFKEDVWTTEYEGVDTLSADANIAAKQMIKWSNPLSNPIQDVTTAGIKMSETTGYRPNKLVLSPYVFNALKNHEDILDRIKYTQKGIVTTDLLATLFEVEHVYVAWAIVNNAVMGAEDNIGFIMGRHALLCYAPKAAGLRQPSAGYIFCWKGMPGGNNYGVRMIKLPDDHKGLGTEKIEIETAYDIKVIAQDLGCFFKDIA